MIIFYALAIIVILQGVSSFIGGVRFLRFIIQSRKLPAPTYAPFTSVFVPCRGLDQGLRQNLTALFSFTYPRYELLFILDCESDPATRVIKELQIQFADRLQVTTQLIIAGPAVGCGQKVHNLRAALPCVAPDSEVYVFVDSDARPNGGWLRALVGPLQHETVGAATGYRWFIGPTFSFPSQLRSLWNASIASALGANNAKNFCWGGATAMRRQQFSALDMAKKWSGVVSDDFALTHALRTADKSIEFVPQCLTASIESTTLAELFEFSTRQMKITRVYAPHLWRAALIGSTLFVSVFFSATGCVVIRTLRGIPPGPPFYLLLTMFALGAGKSLLRLVGVSLALPEHARAIARGAIVHLTCWPLTSALYLYNATAAGFSRQIVWRGIKYKLVDSQHTEVQK